jgi:hypothetical protein
MSINNAFNSLVQLQGRVMSLARADGTLTINIKAAPSNYFRNLAGPEEIVIEGQEFVLRKIDLEVFGLPSRGDVLTDPELGPNTLIEVRPMITFGGAIIGYRVRTG